MADHRRHPATLPSPCSVCGKRHNNMELLELYIELALGWDEESQAACSAYFQALHSTVSLMCHQTSVMMPNEVQPKSQVLDFSF